VLVTLIAAAVVFAATRASDDFAPLIARPHVPPSAHACCSPARARGETGGRFARIALVVDVGCWPQPDASAHAQLELAELLASLGAKPLVLALALACDDLGLGSHGDAQLAALRARLVALRGATVRWLRAGERSSAPATLQLSLLVAQHALQPPPADDVAAALPLERIVFPDGGGLALLTVLAPRSSARPRVSVLALGPLLWRKQWCLSPLAAVSELDESDRERLAYGAADEVLFFGAELREWLQRRGWDLGAGDGASARPERALLAPSPHARARGDGAAGAASGADGEPAGARADGAGRADEPGLVAFVDWADAREVSLLSRVLRRAAALLPRALLPSLVIVPRRAALACALAAASRGNATGATAAAVARAQLLRWLQSTAGWAAPWRESAGAVGSAEQLCSPGRVGLFALADGGARPPPELADCAEAGAQIVCADLPGVRAALAASSWDASLAAAREAPLGAALAAAVERGRDARVAARAWPSLSAAARAEWWAVWARATPSAQPPADASAAAHAAAPLAVSVVVAHCAAQGASEHLARDATRIGEMVAHAQRALGGPSGVKGAVPRSAVAATATALGPCGQAACVGPILSVGPSAAWRAALERAGVPRAHALGFEPRAGVRRDAARPPAQAAGKTVWMHIELARRAALARAAGAREPPRGDDDDGGCASADGLVDALRGAQSDWVLMLAESSIVPLAPDALARLLRDARGAPPSVAALTPPVRECDVDASSADAGRAAGCSLCIPSGAAANAAALSNVLSCGVVLARRSALLLVAPLLLSAPQPVPAREWTWHLLAAAALNGSRLDVPSETLFERPCAFSPAPSGRSRCARPAAGSLGSAHAVAPQLPRAYVSHGHLVGWLAGATELAQDGHQRRHSEAFGSCSADVRR
jgi:hypothetical protein